LSVIALATAEASTFAKSFGGLATGAYKSIIFQGLVRYSFSDSRPVRLSLKASGDWQQAYIIYRYQKNRKIASPKNI